MFDTLLARYGDHAGRLLRFGIVGLVVTGGYSVSAYSAITVAGMTPLAAHLLGCTAAILLSYLGQKYFTFRSDGSHRREMPRFVVACVVAVAASSASIQASTWLGWDYRIGILIAAFVIPLSNFIIMYIWVFASARHRGAAHTSAR